jgi:hypothetical protein
MWKWEKGRQEETEYNKFCLWSFRIWKWGFDAYILKYAPNTRLKWHVDPVKNSRHWRTNLTLKGFASFFIKIDGRTYGGWSNAGWFRPDIQEHMLVTYSESCTKLSFGFVKFD